MKLFFIQSTKEQLIKFEFFRDIINQKINTDEIKNIITEMLESIRDISKIQALSEKYSVHFNASIIKWSMEYDIAIKILEKELQSNNLTYVYELINYCFYYSLFPADFKATFFLMHGILLNVDSFSGELIKKIRIRKYVVYKRSQELCETYLMYEDELSEELEKATIRASTFYETDIFVGTPDINRIYVYQMNNIKK